MVNGYNVHANGIRQHLIHYPGPADAIELLLVPGITSPAITWGFVGTELSKRFDVHILDVRGRGLSQAGDLDYTLDAMADDVVELTRRMARPVVLGHSMGARIAIRAASTDSASISGIILVDPPVSGPNRRPYPASWSWYADSIRLAERGCSAEDMLHFCPSWTEEQRALRAEWLHTCQWGAIRQAFDGFSTDDIHADMATLTLPARLVIAGGATVVLAEDAEEISRLMPQIEIRRVDGAGHMIPWDDLPGFLDSVLDFSA